MGRWAQRTHRGGSPGAAAALKQITSAVGQGGDTVNVTYTGNITAASFVPGTFSTDAAHTGTSVAQDGANSLNVTFDGDVSIDNTMTYAGTVSGVLTPQTVPLT